MSTHMHMHVGIINGVLKIHKFACIKRATEATATTAAPTSISLTVEVLACIVVLLVVLLVGVVGIAFVVICFTFSHFCLAIEDTSNWQEFASVAHQPARSELTPIRIPTEYNNNSNNQ